jgi:hypothetical protein
MKKTLVMLMRVELATNLNVQNSSEKIIFQYAVNQLLTANNRTLFL